MNALTFLICLALYKFTRGIAVVVLRRKRLSHCKIITFRRLIIMRRNAFYTTRRTPRRRDYRRSPRRRRRRRDVIVVVVLFLEKPRCSRPSHTVVGLVTTMDHRPRHLWVRRDAWSLFVEFYHVVARDTKQTPVGDHVASACVFFAEDYIFALDFLRKSSRDSKNYYLILLIFIILKMTLY